MSNLAEWFLFKGFILFVLICLDLWFLSTLEFEENETLLSALNDKELVNMIMILFQTMNQVMIGLTMFMILGGTYLFKVGMLGVLFTQFKKILWMHGLYIVVTLVVGFMRIMARSVERKTIVGVWDVEGYMAVSILQKFVAALYYVANLQLLSTLGQARWYKKDEWVEMYRQAGTHDELDRKAV